MHSPGPPAQPPRRRRSTFRGRSRPSAYPAEPAPRLPRRALWVSATAGGVLAVLIAVTAATGGFASTGSAPEQAPIGKNVDQVRFQSTVLGGFWGQEKVLDKTERFMAARVRVTNTSDKPASLNDYLQSVVPLQAWGGGVLSTIGTKAYTGGTETDELTPGVPTDVVIHYTPDTGQEHATKLSLRFCSFQQRSDFYYRGHQVWVPDCDTWGTFDPREMVSPGDVTGPGLTQAQKIQKSRELNRQGAEARKKKVYNPEGIAAQVDIPLKGGS